MKNVLVTLVAASFLVAACDTLPNRPEPSNDAGLTPPSQWQTYCSTIKVCGLCASEGRCGWCEGTKTCMALSIAQATCTQVTMTPEKCQ